MCDTMGAINGAGHALFAKNSDRAPNEPQVLEFYPARAPDEAVLQTTYLAIEQVAHTYAVLLSRPIWMWGAEMGVNEHGVCIGNEAVFSRGQYGKTGLTGMDLLRLGLERGASAREALRLIIELLEHYGQGGDCGYDKPFFYDNSFLIMDARELFILETAGVQWVYRKLKRGSISNRLAIRDDGDVYRGGQPYDFVKRHRDPVYSYFSGSARRLGQTNGCVAQPPTVASLMAGLRTHSHANPPLTCASIDSTCMHAGGLVGDQTTASLIVELKDGVIDVWATGSSAPCISLFKPWRFGTEPVPPVFTAGDETAREYWMERERFHREAIGHVLIPAFYTERDALETGWRTVAQRASAEEMEALSRSASDQERAFYDKWRTRFGLVRVGPRRFLSYWDKKTATLESPAKPARQSQSGHAMQSL